MNGEEPLPVGLPASTATGGELARVYARWRLALLRSLSRLKSPDLPAEDVLHDAVVKFMTAGTALPDDDATRAYLQKTARNTALEALRERSAGRRLQTVSIDDEVPAADWQAMAAPVDTGPLQAAARRERVRRLGQALDELPARQREAFVLHRFDGLSQDQVAAQMGISRRMVVKHLGRALAYCELRVRYDSAEQMRRQHPRSAEAGSDPARDDEAGNADAALDR